MRAATARVLGISKGLPYTYDNAKPVCDRIDPAAKYRLGDASNHSVRAAVEG